MKKTLALLLLCCSCAAPNDGWRHTAWSPSNSAMWTMDDYAIIQPHRHAFVLYYRPDGQFTKVGTFTALPDAKAAALKREGGQ
jgi:hypothetical protein